MDCLSVSWFDEAADEKCHRNISIHFFLLYYVKFTTLEGRWRCCSVCQQSEISHCSPRRTDWTSLVSDAILIQIDRLSVGRLWLRGASSFSFVTDNIQHNFITLGRKRGSNFMCLYAKVKRPNQPNATLWNKQTNWFKKAQNKQPNQPKNPTNKQNPMHIVFGACSSHAVSFTFSPKAWCFWGEPCCTCFRCWDSCGG